MDLIRHVGTLSVTTYLLLLLGRGEKTEGQHLARSSQRVRGHGVHTHGAPQIEETSLAHPHRLKGCSSVLCRMLG